MDGEKGRDKGGRKAWQKERSGREEPCDEKGVDSRLR